MFERETSYGITGEGVEVGVFSKMGPNSQFWSQKSHFGLILFLNGEMLKPINWRNGVFCPTTDPPLSHC